MPTKHRDNGTNASRAQANPATASTTDQNRNGNRSPDRPRARSHPTRADSDPRTTGDGLPSAIRNLDLEKIKWKLRAEDPEFWASERLELGEREYRRFLALKFAYPRRELVPSEMMDKFWHQHILDTRTYAWDCERIFGRMLHHQPHYGPDGPGDAAEMTASFEETKELYHQTFGEEMPTRTGARCNDKKCHVPSNCRCR